jgi:hypothetical protein
MSDGIYQPHVGPFLSQQNPFFIDYQTSRLFDEKQAGKQPDYNIPLYPELSLLHLCQKFELSPASFFKLNAIHLQVKGG